MQCSCSVIPRVGLQWAWVGNGLYQYGTFLAFSPLTALQHHVSSFTRSCTERTPYEAPPADHKSSWHSFHLHTVVTATAAILGLRILHKDTRILTSRGGDGATDWRTTLLSAEPRSPNWHREFSLLIQHQEDVGVTDTSCSAVPKERRCVPSLR